jgi:hypothetical protein
MANERNLVGAPGKQRTWFISFVTAKQKYLAKMSRITSVGFDPREEQPASNLGAQQTELTSTKSFGNSNSEKEASGQHNMKMRD